MKSKLQLGVIGSVGVPGKYGGFETLAHQLVLHLGEKYDITVYCSKPAYGQNERRKRWQQARLVYLPLRARGIQRIAYVMLSIFHALLRSDVLLLLGVTGALLLPLIKFFSSKKIIVNIDGLPWKRSRNPLRRMYLKWAERIAVKWADEVIADNQKIYDYVQQEYSREATIITYGGNHVSRRQSTVADREQYPFLKERYAVKVCRIEPENNIELILSTFARYPRFSLVIIGNWQEKKYGRDLRHRYKAYRHIHLLDPIYDPATLDILRSNALFYLHGHSAGGTNPSLVEAMSLGLPVLAFDVDFNRETTENGAKYFRNQPQLITLLEAASPEKLAKTGQLLLEIARRRYTWQNISLQYDILIREGVAPAMAPQEQAQEAYRSPVPMSASHGKS